MDLQTQPETAPAECAGKVKAAAIALMVPGVLTVIAVFFDLAMRLLGLGGDPSQFDELYDAAPPEYESLIDSFVRAVETMNSTPVVALSTLITLGVGALIIAGAVKMLQMKSWGLALTAAIVAMMPIPCINPCCCVGLPIGIWALVVLLDSDVKEAFS